MIKRLGLILFFITLATMEINAYENSKWNFENGVLGIGENKTNSKVETNLTEENVKEGKFSLVVSNNSDTSAGIQIPIIHVEPGKVYKASGWLRSSEETKQAYLRIAWYESSDASGSQIKTYDSNKITGKQDWTWIEATNIAPPIAHSAKIRILVSSQSDGTIATAYVDEISWEQESIITPTDEPSSTPTPMSIEKEENPTPTQEYINEREFIEPDVKIDIKPEVEKVLATQTGSLIDDWNDKFITQYPPHEATSSSENLNKRYAIQDIKQASSPYELLKNSWDGWLAIIVGLFFSGTAVTSYIISWKQGEYNKENEN